MNVSLFKPQSVTLCYLQKDKNMLYVDESYGIVCNNNKSQ